jgi:hypothetical protein
LEGNEHILCSAASSDLCLRNGGAFEFVHPLFEVHLNYLGCFVRFDMRTHPVWPACDFQHQFDIPLDSAWVNQQGRGGYVLRGNVVPSLYHCAGKHPPEDQRPASANSARRMDGQVSKNLILFAMAGQKLKLWARCH